MMLNNHFLSKIDVKWILIILVSSSKINRMMNNDKLLITSSAHYEFHKRSINCKNSMKIKQRKRNEFELCRNKFSSVSIERDDILVDCSRCSNTWLNTLLSLSKTIIQMNQIRNDVKVFRKMFDVFLTWKKVQYTNVFLSTDNSFQRHSLWLFLFIHNQNDTWTKYDHSGFAIFIVMLRRNL